MKKRCHPDGNADVFDVESVIMGMSTQSKISAKSLLTENQYDSQAAEKLQNTHRKHIRFESYDGSKVHSFETSPKSSEP